MTLFVAKPVRLGRVASDSCSRASAVLLLRFPRGLDSVGTRADCAVRAARADIAIESAFVGLVNRDVERSAFGGICTWS